MDYKNKYIKYKNKYLQLKYNNIKYIGGNDKNPFINNTVFEKYEYFKNKYNKEFINVIVFFYSLNINNKFFKASHGKKNQISKYNFLEEIIAVHFIDNINKYEININNISLIISNGFLLDTILYLSKNKKYNINNDNIYCYIIKKETQSLELTKDLNKLIQSKNLKNSKYDLKDFIKSKDNIMKDTIIIDYNNHDNNTNNNNILLMIYKSLKQLNKNGDIIIYLRLLQSKYYYDIFNYIGTFFNEWKQNIKPSIANNINLFIIYKNYKGISTKQYTELHDIINDKKKVTITNEINFLKFKNIVLLKEKELLNNYNIIEHILENDDKELLQEMFLFNFINKINYFKSIGLELVDWIDGNGIKKDYYIDKINDLYDDVNTKYILLDKINPLTLKITDNITMSKEDHQLGIDVYNYKDDIYIYEDYSSLQKEVAKKQKQLQDKLLSKYNIRFNNKRVSRAWCKLYEIYRELNFFKNIKKDINMFFICEAPGMWVHSTMDYFKRHMNKKFKWTAQSLKLDGMGLKDNYGFMKKTKENWDYGILGNGDITRYENLEYYKSKYGEFDCVLGDCGLSYNIEKKLTNYNLAIYQMLYSLTLLRKNGNFILKMVGVYKEPLFLSLLEYITSMFNKVYILKASRNFSSSENYIVGINYNKKSDLSKDFIKILKKYKKGEYVYPLSKISSNFVKNYFSVKKELIDYENANIKFYSFLSNNNGMMKLFKSNLDKYITTQNDKWIKKYLL
jgi:23S rRNA U2552 (ribose-2'-O)-methylase RlmE/FtsJ